MKNFCTFILALSLYAITALATAAPLSAADCPKLNVNGELSFGTNSADFIRSECSNRGQYVRSSTNGLIVPKSWYKQKPLPNKRICGLCVKLNDGDNVYEIMGYQDNDSFLAEGSASPINVTSLTPTSCGYGPLRIRFPEGIANRNGQLTNAQGNPLKIQILNNNYYPDSIHINDQKTMFLTKEGAYQVTSAPPMNDDLVFKIKNRAGVQMADAHMKASDAFANPNTPAVTYNGRPDNNLAKAC